MKATDRAALAFARVSRRQFVHGAAGAALSVGALELLAACGSSGSSSSGAASSGLPSAAAGKPGGVAQIAVAYPTQKASLDPVKMASNPEQFMTGLVYDPLVNVNEDTWAVLPGLADKWEANADASQWTFHLRDAEFHNGQPVTSADIVYNIQRHLNPKEGSPLYARLSASLKPDGVIAVDRQTVELKLYKHDAYFPVGLSYCWAGIVPKGNTDQGIGTGPFKVKTWTPGQGFAMVRNKSYWMPNRPYLDGVRAIAINDPTAKVESVTAGSSDITDYIEPSDAANVTGSSSAQVLATKNQAFQNIVFPSKVPPWNDTRVVQAMKLAVDRKKMVEIGLAGNGVVVPDVIVPPTDPAYPSGLSVAQDIEQARSLLKQAGFPNGISFTLHTSTAVSHIVNLAVVFAETVAPAGIKVNVQQEPVQTYFDQFFLGNRPYLDWWNREFVVDEAALLYRTGAPFNETDFKNSEFDDLMSSGQAQTNPAAASKYFAQAMRVMSRDCSQVIAAYSNELLAEKKGFSCEPSLRYIVDFRNAYFS